MSVVLTYAMASPAPEVHRASCTSATNKLIKTEEGINGLLMGGIETGNGFEFFKSISHGN
jgi:hypothetical protein